MEIRHPQVAPASVIHSNSQPCRAQRAFKRASSQSSSCFFTRQELTIMTQFSKKKVRKNRQNASKCQKECLVVTWDLSIILVAFCDYKKQLTLTSGSTETPLALKPTMERSASWEHGLWRGAVHMPTHAVLTSHIVIPNLSANGPAPLHIGTLFDSFGFIWIL